MKTRHRFEVLSNLKETIKPAEAMKDKIPIPSKTIRNNMVKGIILERVGDCEHIEGKHLM
jgi:hypothetical protein